LREKLKESRMTTIDKKSVEWLHHEFDRTYPSKTAQAFKQKLLNKFDVIEVLYAVGSHQGRLSYNGMCSYELLVKAKVSGSFVTYVGSGKHKYNAGDLLVVESRGSTAVNLFTKDLVVNFVKEHWVNDEGQLTHFDSRTLLLAPEFYDQWRFNGKLPDGLIKGLEVLGERDTANQYYIRTTSGLVGVKEDQRSFVEYCHRKDLDSLYGEGVWLYKV
jgi:hypothetical protein